MRDVTWRADDETVHVTWLFITLRSSYAGQRVQMVSELSDTGIADS